MSISLAHTNGADVDATIGSDGEVRMALYFGALAQGVCDECLAASS